MTPFAPSERQWSDCKFEFDFPEARGTPEETEKMSDRGIARQCVFQRERCEIGHVPPV